MIKSSVLIKETEEEPHADRLHPENHKQQPDRRQQQLTDHPDNLHIKEKKHNTQLQTQIHMNMKEHGSFQGRPILLNTQTCNHMHMQSVTKVSLDSRLLY